MYDVFLIDSDFKIERPKRYYRQGLHLLHTGHLDRHSEVDEKANGKGKERLDVPHKKEVDCMSTLGSIRSHVSDVFKRSNQRRSSVEDHPAPLEPDGSDSSSDSSSASSHRATTPMLDPSTNTNPLSDPDEHYEADADGKQKKVCDTKVSKHTFYIENAQMRLKLYAKNEVSDYHCKPVCCQLICILSASNATMDRRAGEGQNYLMLCSAEQI